MTKGLPRTCVAPGGEFIYGIHKAKYTALNLRQNDYIVDLGHCPDQTAVNNIPNFPANHVAVAASSWVFEIPNALPFLGATFILKSYADQMVGNANPFQRRGLSAFDRELTTPSDYVRKLSVEKLPRPLLLALAKTSTDPQVLTKLAKLACRLEYDPKNLAPSGISYERDEKGQPRPAILDEHLFDLVANNPFLPDAYKRQMVLIPGAQGKSPIVGEYLQAGTHIWEYLRENSYIPWGHYAANMAQDAIRYRIASLSEHDLKGLRHLYYQRIYIQLAAEMGLSLPAQRRPLCEKELEDLRLRLRDRIEQITRDGQGLSWNATIWGQNYGFDLSPSGYRLNASHQQIHQQFALVPAGVPGFRGGENESSYLPIGTYVQGDLVGQFCRDYKEKTKKDFFETYLKAIENNKRLDGRLDKESNLVFYQDQEVMAFVPKAQRAQGEVQIMTKNRCGNILEADTRTRNSLDRAILVTMKALENLGVEMVIAYEISKRFDHPGRDQRLIYCFLPRHPDSPGGFSEHQQRWITGHYPEDFAQVCRDKVQEIVPQENQP